MAPKVKKHLPDAFVLVRLGISRGAPGLLGDTDVDIFTYTYICHAQSKECKIVSLRFFFSFFFPLLLHISI